MTFNAPKATFEEWVKQYEGVSDGLHWTDLKLAWNAGAASRQAEIDQLSEAIDWFRKEDGRF